MTSYPGEDPQQPEQPDPTAPYAQPSPYPRPGPYAPPGSWQGYPAFVVRPPAHPQATLAMVLGLVGLIGALMLCGLPLLVSPFAWAIGHNAVREISQSGGALGGESEARVGMITGIIGTAILGLGLLALVAFGGLMLFSATRY